MATLVFFHAHPDDEAMITAGTMAAAADAGHRVVLVVATGGEQGEPKPGVLEPGEELGSRRMAETQRSAEILGVDRVHFLGYLDSGMMGEPTNDDPRSFWRADVEEAATALAGLLGEDGAEALTIYDDGGTYGHPDHIQVHRVGRRAAELAGLPPERLFAATLNRARMQAMRSTFAAAGADLTEPGVEERVEADFDPDTMGVPEEQITHEIDVSGLADRKRRSMRAHQSQISDDDYMMRMPPDRFRLVFGTESYVCLGRARPPDEPVLTDPWAGLG